MGNYFLPRHSSLHVNQYVPSIYVYGMTGPQFRDALSRNQSINDKLIDALYSKQGDILFTIIGAGILEGMECSAGSGLSIVVADGVYALQEIKAFTSKTVSALPNQSNLSGQIFVTTDGSLYNTEPISEPYFVVCAYTSTDQEVTQVVTIARLSLVKNHASTHEYGGNDEISISNLYVVDASSFFDSSNVEDVLQEIGFSLENEVVQHKLLSIAHSDVVPSAPLAGSLIVSKGADYYGYNSYGYSSNVIWESYPPGSEGQILRVRDQLPRWSDDIRSVWTALEGPLTPILRVGAFRYRMPFNATLRRIQIELTQPATGGDVIVDLNVDNVSVWNTNSSNRVRIVQGATSGYQDSFDIQNVQAGQYITFDLDDVGNIDPGADLFIQLDFNVA